MPTPLRLSDSELEIVFAAARPLPVADRDGFLQAVAEALVMLNERGPGSVYRVCRDLQATFISPAALDELRAVGAGSKYSRRQRA